MLSSMTPTMVVRDGKLVLVTGSPGGRTIINTVLSVVLGVTEFGLNVRDAVDAPRLHHQWLPDSVEIEGNAASDEVLQQLRAMGYTVKVGGAQGDANSIVVDDAGGRGEPTIAAMPTARRRLQRRRRRLRRLKRARD